MDSAHEFDRLHASVRALTANGFATPAALATIIRTSGSTFRRAGTSMLIHADGSVVCALSGGCPQRDIVFRAQDVIKTRRSAIIQYNRNSALDVLMEMGCGGELDVLIEPLCSSNDISFFDAIARAQEQRLDGFIATQFAKNAQPHERPRRMIWANGVVWSELDETVPVEYCVQLWRDFDSPKATVACVSSRAGDFDLLFERLYPVHALTLIGANAASVELACIAATLGWRTAIVDSQVADAASLQLNDGNEPLAISPDVVAEKITTGSHASVVVMTFNLERDIAYLNALSGTSLAYLGLIASRERAERMRDRIRTKNVCMPAGLDLGSETPQEIALSISAEILATLNARSAGRLCDTMRPIHSR